MIPKKCPYCGWYFRKIALDAGLFECSNKQCSTILQHCERQAQPMKRAQDDLKPYLCEAIECEN